jgi:hypothetical protein
MLKNPGLLVDNTSIYINACSFSLEGEGWDEEYKVFIFTLLTLALSIRRGRLCL